MCFVDPTPALLAEAKPRATTAVEGRQNTGVSTGFSKLEIVITRSAPAVDPLYFAPTLL